MKRSSGKPKKDDSEIVEELLKATNDGAEVVRPLFTTLLAFTVYFVVIVGSTTHEDLLKGTTLKLPLVDAQISIVGFYFVAPLILVILHFWLLIHFSLICENLHALLTRVKNYPLAKFSLVRQRLDNFTLLHAITHEDRGLYRILLISVNAIVLAAIPVGALLVMQARFLPYHDAFTTWWHRGLLLADMALLSYFWPLTLNGDRLSFAGWWRRYTHALAFGWNIEILVGLHRWLRTLAGGPVSPGWVVAGREQRWQGFVATGRAVLVAVPIFFSWLVLTFPYEGIDRILYGTPPPSSRDFQRTVERLEQEDFGTFSLKGEEELATYRFRFRSSKDDPVTFHRGRDLTLFLPIQRNLSLPEAVLVKGALKPELVDKVRDADPVALNSVEALDLTERNLSFANLTSAALPKVILTKTNLTGARMEGANLVGARFIETDLMGAALVNANLAGSRFKGGNLNGVDFRSAKIQFSYFEPGGISLARFDDADFTGTKFAITLFFASSLTGTNFGASEFFILAFDASDLRESTLPFGERIANVCNSKTDEMQYFAFKSAQHRREALKPYEALGVAIPTVARRIQEIARVAFVAQPVASRAPKKALTCPGWLDEGKTVEWSAKQASTIVANLAQAMCNVPASTAWHVALEAVADVQRTFSEQSRAFSEVIAVNAGYREAKQVFGKTLARCYPQALAAQVADFAFGSEAELARGKIELEFGGPQTNYRHNVERLVHYRSKQLVTIHGPGG